MTRKWIIQDWTGNIKFQGKNFNSFDDAEEFLTEFLEEAKWEYDVYRGEYDIVKEN